MFRDLLKNYLNFSAGSLQKLTKLLVQSSKSLVQEDKAKENFNLFSFVSS